jgi:DNA processing protein
MSNVSDEVVFSIALNGLAGLGPAALRDLLTKFDSAAAVFGAGPASWVKETGHPLNVTLAAADLSHSLARARADAETANNHGARIYLLHAGPYPPLLRRISCPPPVLYVMGEDVSDERRTIAMVGSRSCTHYGEKMAREISEGLVAAGVTTVSGLARGIDTKVHASTIDAGGTTWAVVGNGLLTTYPPENRDLASRICENGAIISEFPMATKPHPAHFPRRNRIIAGLCAATVVVEGRSTSGSLITARLAAEEGREVFAVPGPVTSLQSGAPHRLLRDGAALVESVDDILVELGWSRGVSRGSGPRETAEFPEHVRVVEVLNDVPMDREELVERLALDAKSAATILVQLELKGLIKTLPGGKLVRN